MLRKNKWSITLPAILNTASDSYLLCTPKSHSHSSPVFSVKLFRMDIAVIWVFFLPCLVKHTFLPSTDCMFPLSQLWCFACISQSVWKTAAINAVWDDRTIPVSYCVVYLLYAWGSERMMKKSKTHYSMVCHQITGIIETKVILIFSCDL